MEEQLHQKNQEESNDHQAKTHSNGRGHGHKHGHGHKEEHLHEDHKKNHETLAQIFEKHGVKQDSSKCYCIVLFNDFIINLKLYC